MPGLKPRPTASQPLYSRFRVRNRRGRDGQAHFSRGGFDFTVDLSAQKKHQTGDIEPGQQNNHRAKRPVSKRIGIEVMKVDTEAEGGQEPSEQAQGPAGREPVPAAFLRIRSPIVDDGEGEVEKSGCHDPTYNSRRDR